MKRDEIEKIRDQVSCGTVLQQAGFRVDVRESTPRAVKYRRSGEIAIVTHGGRGWFDPLSDNKGDVFGLHAWLQPGDFRATLQAVAALAGIQPSQPAWEPRGLRRTDADITARWSARPVLSHGSPAYGYLAGARAIPHHQLKLAINAQLIRQGPFGSAWFAHQDSAGRICGWEERGPQWRGFSSGGAKTLFRFGNPAGGRLCITEAAIDALSLSALDGRRADTLYASTAGGWSRATESSVMLLAECLDLVVAATDRDGQGEAYADKLRGIALRANCGFQRLRPFGEDWNEDLKQRRNEEED
ncbi:DUF3991 and TOPRIM domain-containing protein [Rhizobium tubonense]|uniref:DUF3991 domain-containing protein n=1 Tax=Rhizobium tubonense TaxID=484088 RepID=A0A2W4CW34_9HYPH|nr:DUF3991 and TOPRIM domain-containing protein [Rhizobium tubonense]PZM16479.1 hypothetical protein CPY51_03935 [Rhizobium tubonense]